MDLLCTVLIAVLLVLLAVLLVRYTSATHDTFQKLGIDTPPPSRLFGNLGEGFKLGVFGVQTTFYNMFRDKKVYGWYDRRTPIMIIRDLDMIKDVLVKHSNCFVNRPSRMEREAPFKDNMMSLKDDHWKRVRNTVSPIFTSGRLKRMSQHVERNVQRLMGTLLEKCERNEELELKEICSRFTLDIIASTGFGMEIDTLTDPENAFAREAKKVMQPSGFTLLMAILFPKFRMVLQRLGLPTTQLKSFMFFSDIIDSALISRKNEERVGTVHDFLDLLIDAEKESGETGKGKLTASEIQGQALLFLFAGYDTVSSVLSFTLFLLAVHPEHLQKVQEEIDRQTGKEVPRYDNVQHLAYLDMCINEAIRMYPPGFMLDRQCSEAVDIQDVHFPKDMSILVPVYAIHHDPEIYPEPEKFQPERFSLENKESRHPYAHIPFGAGPRNCIGMRLALLELRMTLTSILQRFTPVQCEKTVYPVMLNKFLLVAKDGLWVKLEERK